MIHVSVNQETNVSKRKDNLETIIRKTIKCAGLDMWSVWTQTEWPEGYERQREWRKERREPTGLLNSGKIGPIWRPIQEMEVNVDLPFPPKGELGGGGSKLQPIFWSSTTKKGTGTRQRSANREARDEDSKSLRGRTWEEEDEVKGFLGGEEKTSKPRQSYLWSYRSLRNEEGDCGLWNVDTRQDV